MITQVRRRFEVDLPLRSLFDAPTVGGLAAIVRELGGGRPPAPVQRSGSRRGDPSAAGNGPVPLSFAQERFWFLQQFNPESSAFNMKVSVQLSGVLDLGALRASFAAMLSRHPVLRANFHAVAGKPVQTLSDRPLEVPLLDLSALEPPLRVSLGRRLATESADRPFDLTRDRLLRVCLIRLAEREHVAVLTLHHIVGDGWSVGILCRELADHYQAFSQGLARSCPSCRFSIGISPAGSGRPSLGRSTARTWNIGGAGWPVSCQSSSCHCKGSVRSIRPSVAPLAACACRPGSRRRSTVWASNRAPLCS